MHTFKSLTVLVTLLGFFVGSFSQAQSNTSYQYATANDAAQNTIPTMQPYPLNMAGLSQEVAGKMSLCKMQAIAQAALLGGILGAGSAGGLAGAAAGAATTATPKPGEDSPGCDGKKGLSCSMVCSEPKVSEKPSCGTYFHTTKENSSSSTNAYSVTDFFTDKSGASTADRYQSDEDAVNAYAKYLDFKSTCDSDQKKALDEAYASYDCMMGVLEGETNKAASQISAAIQQNNSQFQKMGNFVSQVTDQVKQIDDLLGPADEGNGISKLGGAQFQGFLGMQKSLNDQLSQMNKNKTDFQTRVAKVQRETTANEQTLEADRMGVVSSCMKGETDLGVPGGYSLMCYKPRMSKDSTGASVEVDDAQGNPVYAKQSCGPMEYIRSQIQQAAFINGNRGVIRNQTRRDQSADNTAEFDAFLNSVMRDLGDYDASTSDGKLAPRMTSWSDISGKYANEMADLKAKTGIDVASQMNSVAGHCFSDSQTWKQQQENSAASTYNKNKATIQTETSDLTNSINQGLTDMNNGYGASTALLWGQTASIPCAVNPPTDPAAMESCYESVGQNLQNILAGNGNTTTTTKVLTGGSLVANTVITCRGVNPCVTALQQAESAKNTQKTNAQKSMADFVTSTNGTVSGQLTSFATSVGQVQNVVLQQYSAIKKIMDQLGATAPDQPNFMTGEALKNAEGPPPGPFQMPSDMSKAIASGIAAPGLINFQDTGMDKLKDNANTKLDKETDDLVQKAKDYKDTVNTLAELEDTCKKDDNPPPPGFAMGGSGVGNDSFDPASCNAIRNACYANGAVDSGVPADSSWISSIANLMMNSAMAGDKTTQAAVAQLSSAASNETDQASDCAKALAKCEVAVNSKEEKYNSNESDAQKAGNANK